MWRCYVDDFAFRKGRHYGTLLIDMTTHRPLHLSDGREGEDLAAWLHGHPEVKVICRDRSSGYSEGARIGAPWSDGQEPFCEVLLEHVEGSDQELRGKSCPA